jgi:tartrate-resistant acid phosphatase type 5
VLAWLLRLWRASWRFRLELSDEAERRLQRGEPCVLAHWHEDIPALLGAASRVRVAALLSTSPDGEWAAPLVAGLGIQAVRGAGRSPGEGATLFRAGRRALQRGPLSLALDGSRGPRRTVRPGAAALAESAGVPLLPVAAAAWPAIRLGSWDRMRVPLPFAAVTVAVGEPVDGDGVAAAIEQLEPRARPWRALAAAAVLALLSWAPAAAGGAGAPAVAPAGPVRFAAIGDTGRTTDRLGAVAGVLADVCTAQGCDFVLLLGDNAYDEGLESVDDPRWRTLFEEPFAAVDAPFHPVLGNHDGGGWGVDHGRGDVQVAYSSDRWDMPGRWYALRRGVVDLFALDTPLAQVCWGPAQALRCGDRMATQRAWLRAALAAPSAARWRIAFGHHPLRSDGQHGDAGRYDGVGLVPWVGGHGVRGLVGEVCGEVDVYLSGHDHNRQWLDGDCAGTQLMVSGAGAKLTPLRGERPLRFGDDELGGFAWFEATETELRVEFWNERGERDHAGRIER